MLRRSRRLRVTAAALAFAGVVIGCSGTESGTTRTTGPPGQGDTSSGIASGADRGDEGSTAPDDAEVPATGPPGTAPRPRPEPLEFTEGRRKLVEADVPDLAAKAYLNASVRVAEDHPGCVIPPAVLVAFGRQESNHGRVAEWDETGRSRTILRGYANTGSDTDKGELDGDTEADWAVGAMQFIPTTWKAYAQDGDGDGKAEPGNFFDSALSSAWHICDLVGGFPAPSVVSSAWSQYDATLKATEAAYKERKRLWQHRWDQYIFYSFSLLASPDDTGLQAGVRQWQNPGPEPQWSPPGIPPGASQLILAAERYYGPAGETRDDYVERIAGGFRAIAIATGDLPYGPSDKVRLING